jgi:hypothetical protein
MNRIQFFVLTGLSSLVVLLVIGQIFLLRQANYQQMRFNQAQQTVNMGSTAQALVKQLAIRIFQDANKTQDPGLQKLLERQQIKYTPGSDTNATETPAPPAPTR